MGRSHYREQSGVSCVTLGSGFQEILCVKKINFLIARGKKAFFGYENVSIPKKF